jgi:hypothetical protein
MKFGFGVRIASVWCGAAMLLYGVLPSMPAVHAAGQQPQLNSYESDLLFSLGHSSLKERLQRLGYQYVPEVQPNGALPMGESFYYPVTINRLGYSYVFMAACDYRCRNLDLDLRDYLGRVVAEDTKLDSTPAVEFTPTAVGNYVIRPIMTHCSATTVVPNCYWRVMVLSKWVGVPYAE